MLMRKVGRKSTIKLLRMFLPSFTVTCCHCIVDDLYLLGHESFMKKEDANTPPKPAGRMEEKEREEERLE